MGIFSQTLLGELGKVAVAGLDAASAPSAKKRRGMAAAATAETNLENCTPCALAAKREAATDTLSAWKKRVGIK